MKQLIIIFGLFLILSVFGCKDETRIMSATQDDKELSDDTYIPVQLLQNHPNPFSGSTVIRYRLSIPMKVSFAVYTEDWIKIISFSRDYILPGSYSIMLSGHNDSGELLPSGDYYYVLEADGYKLVRKMKIIR